MSMEWSSVRWFRAAVHVWVLGYLTLALPDAELLWDPGLAPLSVPPGIFRFATHAFGTWLPTNFAIPAALLVCVFAIWELIRPGKWWRALVIWTLYTSLMNLAWSAASGGQQLIANMLFWLILLPARPQPAAIGTIQNVKEILELSAFWIIRVQLVLAYAVTATHKLTGDLWTHGQAVGVVVTDPAYGPFGLADHPLVMQLLTYGALIFQAGFAFAVWWRPTRIAWMVMGVLFHLGTGFGMGIPDMAFAFLVCYPIWFRSIADRTSTDE